MAMAIEIYEDSGFDKKYEENISKIQRRREVNLAITLRKKISEPDTPEASSAWLDAERLRIEALMTTPFANILLNGVGWAYQHYGKQYLEAQSSYFGMMKNISIIFMCIRNIYINVYFNSNIHNKLFLTSYSSGIGVQIHKMKARQRNLNNNWNAISSAIKTTIASRGKNANSPNNIDESVPLVMDTILAFCVLDVEQTVKNVVNRVSIYSMTIRY